MVVYVHEDIGIHECVGASDAGSALRLLVIGIRDLSHFITAAAFRDVATLCPEWADELISWRGHVPFCIRVWVEHTQIISGCQRRKLCVPMDYRCPKDNLETLVLCGLCSSMDCVAAVYSGNDDKWCTFVLCLWPCYSPFLEYIKIRRRWREKQAFIVTQLEYVIVWLRTSFIYKRSKGQSSDPVGKDFEGWSSWSIMPRHFGLPNLKIAPCIGVVPNAQKRVPLQ